VHRGDPGDLLDALVGAYTGLLYLRDEVDALGDPAEGLLYIPAVHVISLPIP